MYAHEFVQQAVRVLCADAVDSKLTAYEQLRAQTAQCLAHVIVNGKQYAFGCVHPGDARATRACLEAAYAHDVVALSADMEWEPPFTTWEQVEEAAPSFHLYFPCQMNALDNVLGKLSGADQDKVHDMLTALHAAVETEHEIDTCMRECRICEGDTVETHFGCLALRNAHITVEEWFVILLGYLVHSVAVGNFLPYYSRKARIPGEDAVYAMLDTVTASSWDLSCDEDVVQQLCNVWGLDDDARPRTAADIVALLPPTSCYTFELFSSMVNDLRRSAP